MSSEGEMKKTLQNRLGLQMSKQWLAKSLINLFSIRICFKYEKSFLLTGPNSNDETMLCRLPIDHKTNWSIALILLPPLQVL